MSTIELGGICRYRTESMLVGSLPYVTTESMLPNKSGIAGKASAPSSKKARFFRNGDTLISNIRPYFKKIWQAEYDGCCSADVLVFEPSNCDADYLYWLLSNDVFFSYMVSTAKGTKMPRGDKSAIMHYALEHMDVSEQRAIAGVLNPIRELIATNQHTNDYLKQCAMTLFSQFYMDRWGEDLPDGWSYQRVEEFAEKVAMGPFGSNIKVETFVDEGVPIISSAHLRGLLLEELEYNHITEEHANRLANSMVYPGDIVFTHAGNIGQASLVTKWAAEPKYMISQRQFYLRCNQDKMLSEIPALYFHTRVGCHVLTANSSSTGVPSIAQPSSYLKSIEIIVPDMESQHAFVNQIEPMLHQYVVNEKEIRRLEQLRDALLPKLMSGEIDVSQIELPKQSNNHLCES